MSKQTRHVIYMSDDEWAGIKERAAQDGVSISEVFRTMWSGVVAGLVTAVAIETGTSDTTREEVRVGMDNARKEWEHDSGGAAHVERIPVGPHMTQAERDAILRRISKRLGSRTE